MARQAQARLPGNETSHYRHRQAVWEEAWHLPPPAGGGRAQQEDYRRACSEALFKRANSSRNAPRLSHANHLSFMMGGRVAAFLK